MERRVEQHGAVDPLGREGRELGDEQAAEAVPEPGGPLEPERVGRLAQVCHMGRGVPGRFPPGAAVTAQVEADDPSPLQASGQRPEARPVPGHPVQADDRRPRRIAPLVRVEDHAPTASTILP